MPHDTSPGTDRALAEAERIAAESGEAATRLGHLLQSLVADPDGKPMALLTRLGLEAISLHEPSPILHRNAILNVARDWSLARRGDPTVMTDALLIVTLRGGSLDALADRIESLLAVEPSPMASPDDPPTTFADVEELDFGAARALDANFNRGREALRVLEDYCRFVKDDAFLTGEVKAARHDLAEASKRLPPRALLASRDTLGDVGVSATAEGEYRRGTTFEVARVNLKRLQESLRSLEEFGKLHGPELARDLEAIRYRAYTLERAILFDATAREILNDARLYLLISGSQCSGSPEWTIRQAVAGGVDVVQLREKNRTDRELLEQARFVRRVTREAGALFIVNDRPDIAKLAEADGVHLGQDDLSVRDARRILGAEPLVGVSTHSIDQVHRAIRDGADYIGIGPTFPSATKSFDSFPGLDFIRAATAATSLPAFALGGIDVSNVAEVVKAGARRVAVSSCLATATDPESVARVLRAALNG